MITIWFPSSFLGSGPTMSLATSSNGLASKEIYSFNGCFAFTGSHMHNLYVKLSHEYFSPSLTINNVGASCHTPDFPLDGMQILDSVPSTISVWAAKSEHTAVALHALARGGLFSVRSQIGTDA